MVFVVEPRNEYFNHVILATFTCSASSNHENISHELTAESRIFWPPNYPLYSTYHYHGVSSRKGYCEYWFTSISIIPHSTPVPPLYTHPHTHAPLYTSHTHTHAHTRPPVHPSHIPGIEREESTSSDEEDEDEDEEDHRHRRREGLSSNPSVPLGWPKVCICQLMILIVVDAEEYSTCTVYVTIPSTITCSAL